MSDFSMFAYYTHLRSVSAPLDEFYLEILGADVAELNVANLGDFGVFHVNEACSMATFLLFEILLLYICISHLWSLFSKKKFWRILGFGLTSLFCVSLLLTTTTRKEIASNFYNDPVDFLPQLVEVDYIPVNTDAITRIFLSFSTSVQTTWLALKLWALTLLLILGPLIRILIQILIIVTPILKNVTQNLIILFLSQDQTNIYLEIATVVFFILSWLLKRHIERERFDFYVIFF
jgi:hypothetical protein